jgi:hypothetical protein
VRRKPNGPFRPGATSRAITPVDIPSSAIHRADIDVLTVARHGEATTARARAFQEIAFSWLNQAEVLKRADADCIRKNPAFAAKNAAARPSQQASLLWSL